MFWIPSLWPQLLITACLITGNFSEWDLLCGYKDAFSFIQQLVTILLEAPNVKIQDPGVKAKDWIQKGDDRKFMTFLSFGTVALCA